MHKLRANSKQNSPATRWWGLSVFRMLHKKFKNASLWWHTRKERKRKRLIIRYDGKFWLCEGLSVFPWHTEIHPCSLRSLASWCLLNNPKPLSPLPPPPPTVFKGFSFYGARMGEDPEVRMIGLVFLGVGNIDMWPLPAGPHPPKCCAGGIVPTPLCQATNCFSFNITYSSSSILWNLRVRLKW